MNHDFILAFGLALLIAVQSTITSWYWPPESVSVNTIISSIKEPRGIVVSPDGESIFISDLTLDRISKWDTISGDLSTLAGSDFDMNGWGDASYGKDAYFDQPWGIAMSMDTKIYVADNTRGNIRVIDSVTSEVKTIASGLSSPRGLAIAKFNPKYLYVSVSHRIVAIDLSSATLDTSNIAGDPYGSGNVDAVGSLAKFSNPYDITVNHNATLMYVADTSNGAIRKIDMSTFEVTTIKSGLSSPQSLVLSPDESTIYITETGGHQILSVDMTSFDFSTLTFAGSGISGYADGIGTSAQFASPYSMAIDPTATYLIVGTDGQKIRKIDLSTRQVSTLSSNLNAASSSILSHDNTILYIADRSNHRIRELNISSGAITTIAGSNEGGTGSDNYVGTDATFHHPTSLAISSLGTAIYITDYTNGMIRKLDYSSNQVYTIKSGIAYPWGIAINSDSTRMYVSQSQNHRISVIDLQSTAMTTLAGTGATGTTDSATGTSAKFNDPLGIAISPDDKVLWVADSVNNRIREINIATTRVTTKVNTGLNRPRQIVVAPAGDVLFVTCSDSHSIMQIDLHRSNGARTLAGSGSNSYIDGSGLYASIGFPYGLAFDSTKNRIYVTQNTDNRIRMITFPQNPTFINSRVTITVKTLDEQISNLRGVVSAPDGRHLYLTTGNEIKVFDTHINTIAPFFGTGSSAVTDTKGSYSAFSSPTGIDLTSDGLFLFVADTGNGRLREIDLNTNKVTSRKTGLSNPRGVITSKDGNTIYYTDTGYHRVWLYDRLNNVHYLLAGPSSTSTSATGATNGRGSTALFNNPWGICISNDGRTLYVSDNGNDLIRQIDIKTQEVSTFISNIESPRGIQIKGSTMFIAEYGLHRITQIDMETRFAETLAGSLDGSSGYADGNGAQAEFTDIEGLGFSINGNALWVAQLSGSRLRKVIFANIDPTYGNYTFSPCDEGMYQKKTIDGDVVCATCPAGKFSNFDIGTSSCSLCTSATYAAYEGATKCTACGVGTYSTIIGANSWATCNSCEAGFYMNKTGSTFCTPCEPGYYSTTGASSCIKCPKGTYSPGGLFRCALCPPGTYGPDEALTHCLTCPDGLMQLAPGSHNCSSCTF